MSFSLFCFVSSCPHLLSMASLYFAESYSAWYKSVKVVSTNPSYVRIYILFFFFFGVCERRELGNVQYTPHLSSAAEE